MAPPVLWSPSAASVEATTMHRFLAANGFEDYASAWRWSVDDLEGFWGAVASFFDVRFSTPPERVLGSRSMPGAAWFAGSRVSYAEHVFRGASKSDDAAAIHFASETRATGSWTWGDLRRETAQIRAGLVALGVGEGDRVCAYLPNLPETIAAFLACASLGAVWSSAAPEFGSRSVIDRFAQIEPKVLLAVDGYVYGGKTFDRTEQVEAIHREVGGALVRLGYLDGTGWQDGFLRDGPLEFAALPFDHPLWILFSSGTTGLPKAIVHSQGGILLEHVKHLGLHADARPGDRLFWFTTTGWMMWNFLVGGLLPGAEIVLFDGNPAGDVLWDLADELQVDTFGTSAAWIDAQRKDGATPRKGRNLKIRAVGSTGSPLSIDGFRWVYDQLGPDLWLFSTSGGTDVCTAFVGGVPTLPVREGELQARALGCKVEAWDRELVITAPMPSMPVFFWNDPDGSKYHDAYFDTFDGVWRHGDFLDLDEETGGVVISGRSDSTINRGGVRMGTAEIYRAVLAIDQITDALVVDVDDWMPLFVVLRPGIDLDDDLRRQIAARVRADCSPRHVPDEVFVVDEIPRTLSGKVLEVPVKKILQGIPLEQAASKESLKNPAALDPFLTLRPPAQR